MCALPEGHTTVHALVVHPRHLLGTDEHGAWVEELPQAEASVPASTVFVPPVA